MTNDERLEHLERALQDTRDSLGRTRRALALAGLAAVAALTLAAVQVPSVISAREFVVTDAQGHPRLRLGCGAAGAGALFLDEQGHPRIVLENSAQGPYLHLMDGHGVARSALAALDGGPALTFSDADGHVRVGLGDLKDEPNMTLMDESGKAVWSTR